MQPPRFPLFIFFIVLSFTHFSAQPKPGGFVSGDGRFSIDVSTKPAERKKLNYSLLSYELDGEAIIWKDDDGNYVEVQCTSVFGENINTKPKVADRAKIIAAYKTTFLDELKNAKVMTNEKPFVFDGMPGIEIRGIAAKILVTRLFFTKYRFIALTITRPKEEGFDAPVNLANTFRFLSNQEYSDALIAENMPTPLPQTLGYPRPTSDAVTEEGLQGKVASVITEEQATAAKPKVLSEADFFDISGNYVRQISYMDGYPMDLTQWGWIDGDRVSSLNFVSYSLGEGPNAKQIVSIIGTPLGAPPETLKRDERYGTKYKYKYDPAGKLIEKIEYENNGEELLRTAFTYEANKRTSVRRYASEDTETKYVEFFDANGDLIEEQRFDGKKLDFSTVYKYDKFDATGNWTVRRSFDKKITRSKTVLKPEGTTFRTIRYH